MTCENSYLKLSIKNVIKLAKGSLNNIFQDSFNKIKSQQLTHDRAFMYETELYARTTTEEVPIHQHTCTP